MKKMSIWQHMMSGMTFQEGMQVVMMPNEENKWAILFECKGTDNGITEAGDLAWIVEEPEGWVDGTSRKDAGYVPKDVKVFDTRAGAQIFFAMWAYHPYHHQPNGKYEVVAIEPVYRRVIEKWTKKKKCAEGREPS